MLQNKRLSRNLIFALCCAVTLLLPLVIRQYGYAMHVLILVLLFGYLSTAWNLLGGYAGQMSFGHGVFMGIGAYASTVLYVKYGVNPWIALLLAAILCAVLGAVIGSALFRLRTMFFIMASMSLLSIAKLLVVYFKKLTNGSMGLSLPLNKTGLIYLNFSDKIGFFYVAAALLLISLLISYKIKYSKLGLDLLALRDDHDAAESLGIDTFKAKIVTMAISAFLVSIAGSFYANYVLFIDPPSIFSVDISTKMAVMPMVGGIATVFGPLLGAVLLIPVDTILRAVFGGGSLAGLNLIIYGIIMIVVVWFLPRGIVPKLQQIQAKKAFKKKTDAKESVTDGEQTADCGGVMTGGTDKDADVFKEVFSKNEHYDPILEVKNLTVRFGGLVAVNNVSFKVEQGEILGLIGPNGAGKTTVFNAVSGFVQRTEGFVAFTDKIISKNAKPHAVSQMGVVRTFQIVRPFEEMTVRENVLTGAVQHLADREQAGKRADFALALVGLEDKAMKDPPSLTVADKKRLDIARALAVGPKLLMLDEPMAGLTHNEVDEMIRLVKIIAQYGITVIIIEHVMNAVMNLCDRVIVLDHGSLIASGTPAEVVKDPQVINVYLGDECDD